MFLSVGTAWGFVLLFGTGIVMDIIRQILTEGNEVAIGSFGKFTVITDLSGNKTVMLCPAKSFKQAINAGEGII